MHLSAIIASYCDHPDRERITLDLHRAMNLGHEFGIERAAEVVDQCNKEGPYSAIGAASRIRKLVVADVKPARTIDQDFV